MTEGKVRRAVLYTCVDYAISSRNNEVGVPREIFEGGDHNSIMKALKAFATCPERCKLVLELDNGQEIGLMPVLQDSYPAFGEPNPNNLPAKWDLSVDILPK